MLFIVKNQYNKIRKYIEANGNWVYEFSFITIDKKNVFSTISFKNEIHFV